MGCHFLFSDSPHDRSQNYPRLQIFSLDLMETSCPQVRRAIQQMLFPSKSFNWLRHIAIAVVLLTVINLLVIFAPNILDIFGIIGQ